MKVFVVNCGSSSIKYKLMDMADESVLAGGTLERVAGEAALHHAAGEREIDRDVAAPDHAAGMRLILDVLVDPDVGVISSIDEIDAVGHRVVHGGVEVSRPCLVDDALIDCIRRHEPLSPLHNPPNLAGIEAARAAMDAPQVAVFDTAFFTTVPPEAHRYPVPEAWYAEHHVRKYGFHGTSHRYVAAAAAERLGRAAEETCLITAHLGNGCSMTAVDRGRAVEHSMGMTPVAGLMMGTRSGDIDPAVIPYMVSRGLSIDEVERALNKESGLLGVSGVSNDMRDVQAAEAEGNERAALARRMFVYRLAWNFGAQFAVLDRLDALVLTGGIGENAASIRADLCRRLARYGVVLDEARNAATVAGEAGAITADDSALAVWVVPTNEELMIARDTVRTVRP